MWSYLFGSSNPPKPTKPSNKDKPVMSLGDFLRKQNEQSLSHQPTNNLALSILDSTTDTNCNDHNNTNNSDTNIPEDWLMIDDPMLKSIIHFDQDQTQQHQMQLWYLHQQIQTLNERVQRLEEQSSAPSILSVSSNINRNALCLNTFSSNSNTEDDGEEITPMITLRLSADVLQKGKQKLRKTKKSINSSSTIQKNENKNNNKQDRWVIVKPSVAFQQELKQRVSQPSLRKVKHLTGKRKRKDPHKIWMQQLCKDMTEQKLRLKPVVIAQ